MSRVFLSLRLFFRGALHFSHAITGLPHFPRSKTDPPHFPQAKTDPPAAQAKPVLPKDPAFALQAVS